MTDPSLTPVTLTPTLPAASDQVPPEPVAATTQVTADPTPPAPAPVPAPPTPVPEPAVDPTAESAVSPDAPASADESPLDALDRILKEAQAKAGEQKASEEAAEKERIAEMSQRQRQLDQQQIAAQLQEIEEAKHTPQHEALVAMETKQVEDQKQQQAAQQGTDIHQLSHTKIEVPET